MTAPQINYEALQTDVREEILDTYKHSSLLAYFPAVEIPGGIATEKWAQKYIMETKRAGIHPRGFNPNTIKMDFRGFEIKPYTIDQKCELNEIDLAQYQKNGMFPKIVPELGKNLAFSANTAIMMQKDGNGNSLPAGEYGYHYILADGDGSNGTADQPLWLHDAASAGVWSTWANFIQDIANLKGNFIAKGGNLASAICFVPRCAAPHLIKKRSEYNDLSVEDYIKNEGLPLVYIEDEFFYTQAGALPTAALFDIILVDVSEVIVGYERNERVLSGPGAFPDRNYYIEAEVWPRPLMVPFRKNESGTIKTYKSMSRIRAIAQA